MGGIKEKVLAAHRGGIKHVVLPHRNAKDLVELPANVRKVGQSPLTPGMNKEVPVPPSALPYTASGPQDLRQTVKPCRIR